MHYNYRNGRMQVRILSGVQILTTFVLGLCYTIGMNISKTPEYKRAHKDANKTKYAEYTRLNREKKKRIYREAKNKPCADCGILYPWYVMDFDHQRDKEFNISNNFYTFGIEKLLVEIAKCDVVCSNCHRLRTFKNHPDNENAS